MRKYFLLLLILPLFLYAQSFSNFISPKQKLYADLGAEQAAPLKKMTDSNWWTNETLTVEGYGVVPRNYKGIGDGRIIAKRTAMIDGYRNLAKAAGKIQITASETLTEQKIEALITGANVLAETYDADGNCTVVLTVPIYGVKNSLAKVAFEPVEKENFPAPRSNVAARGNYTGLIVDCGDLELNPVLSPVVRDTLNQSVYSYKNLDFDKVIAKGMIGYVEKNPGDLPRNEAEPLLLLSSKTLLVNTDTNLSRAGANPLIIKAASINDDNSCPIISQDDTDRILAENLRTHFLDEGAVVFTSNRIRGMRM